MTDPDYKIFIQGPDAEDAANELPRFFEREFDFSPSMLKLDNNGSSENNKDLIAAAGLMVGAATLILTVPQAILAVSDLVERMGNKPKMDDLVETAQKLREKNPGTKITIETGGAKIVLHGTNTTELLDAFDKK